MWNHQVLSPKAKKEHLIKVGKVIMISSTFRCAVFLCFDLLSMICRKAWLAGESGTSSKYDFPSSQHFPVKKKKHKENKSMILYLCLLSDFHGDSS